MIVMGKGWIKDGYCSFELSFRFSLNMIHDTTLCERVDGREFGLAVVVGSWGTATLDPRPSSA